MTDQCVARHGLEAFLAQQPNASGVNPGIAIEVSNGRGYLNLRGDSQDRGFVATAEESLGQSLPVVANTMSRDDLCVYWLGPNEWLISGPRSTITAVAECLAMAVACHAGTLNDLSGAYAELTLSGDAVADVVAKGCTLDLHAMMGRGEYSAQCGLAKAAILLTIENSDQGFGIIVRRSFAEYVSMWLAQAAEEFGVQFTVA